MNYCKREHNFLHYQHLQGFAFAGLQHSLLYVLRVVDEIVRKGAPCAPLGRNHTHWTDFGAHGHPTVDLIYFVKDT
jgi:hypothetical protein